MESLFNLSIIKLGKNTLYILQDIISLLKKKKKKNSFFSFQFQFNLKHFNLRVPIEVFDQLPF